MKKIFFFSLILLTMAIIAQEQKLQYFGTVYNTVVNDDRVNVRDNPSLKGNILFQTNRNVKIIILGVSKEHDFIDNYSGYWVKIRINDNQQNEGKEGWIFSKYVDYRGNIIPSEIRILEMPPQEEGRAQKLLGVYQINGKAKNITLYPHKEEHQDFYTFAYDIDDDAFHFTNIPGSYVWYPDTNELKHTSYIGTSGESAWVVFTDDFKYIIEDFGTGPAPRALGVWRVNDGKEIFSGSYYGKINLQEYAIEVIYLYDRWNIENKRLDNEILIYAENFKKNNPEPPEKVEYSRKTGLGLDLIIVCKLNLDTGMRQIIKGQYIHTQ